MKRIMLTVSYDGTAYHGWQIQPTGITVEEVLNRKLSELLKEDVRVLGVSRTDSGVHALANLCVFDTGTRIPPEKICFALNERLPEDIVIRASEEVPEGFHPRRCDSIKTYEYTVYHSRIPNPIERRTSYFFYMRLDVEAMRTAAQYLVGLHDFKSFCSARTQVESTVRQITALDIREEGEKIIFRISGTGFLYNMVRIVVGTLLKVGVGVWTPEHVREILDAKDRQLAGPKVPPQGLCLMSIRLYPEGYPAEMGIIQTKEAGEDDE